MPLTGAVDNANARIDLFVDYAAETGTHTTATLLRHEGSATADGIAVRGLDGGLLLGEQAYVSDHEAPLDVAVHYSVTSDTGLTLTAGPFTIVSSGFVWLKDPGRPWADLRLDLCLTPSRSETPESCTVLADPIAWIGFGDRTRAVDAGLFPVLNRERPSDVYARRKDIVTTIMFLSRALPAIASVYDLFTVGGPLLVQVPDVYGMDNVYGQSDRYYQPGDLSEELLSTDQRKSLRMWTAPATAVDSPAGPPQGTDTANWCAIEETYETMGDLAASGYTWGDVADGSASVVPPSFDGYGGGAYGSGPYGD